MSALTVPQRVGRAVREAREAAGMTQAGLGARVGVTGPAIGHIEAGIRDTTVTRLAAIAEVLHLDLGDLLAQEAVPAPGAPRRESAA